MSDPGGESHVAGQREAHELLLIEEADAWFEYLEATRAQSALRYKEGEPWAWAGPTRGRRPECKGGCAQTNPEAQTARPRPRPPSAARLWPARESRATARPR